MEIKEKIRHLTDESLNSFDDVLNSKRCAGLIHVACLECPLRISGDCLRNMVKEELQRRQILSEASARELLAELNKRSIITEVKSNGS